MGIFSRGGGASVIVSPAVVSPRQTVQATVTTDKPIDKVSVGPPGPGGHAWTGVIRTSHQRRARLRRVTAGEGDASEGDESGGAALTSGSRR